MAVFILSSDVREILLKYLFRETKFLRIMIHSGKESATFTLFLPGMPFEYIIHKVEAADLSPYLEFFGVSDLSPGSIQKIVQEVWQNKKGNPFYSLTQWIDVNPYIPSQKEDI